MSGLDITAIRQAIADQLRTNLDRETNVYPYWVEAPQFPCVMVVPEQGGEFVSYFRTFTAQGLSELRFELHIWTVGTDATSAQRAIDDYLSAGGDNQSSVLDAVMTDPTLNGVVESCVPLTALRGPMGPDPQRAIVPLQVIVRKDARA